MNEQNKPESTPNNDLENRRKVLRGLVGLPAMATMSSAGATQALTSNLECLIERNEVTETLTANADSAGNIGVDPKVYNCVKNTGNYQPIGAQVNDGLNTYDLYEHTTDETAALRANLGQPTGDESYCAVYFDQNGAFTGFNTNSGYPTTPSCLTSFA